jgi:type I restriction enzyme S subunit
MKKGWKTEPLGELCDIRNGSTPSKGNPAFWDEGTIPWFTIDDMREQGRAISSTRQKITKTALSETSVKLLPENSVLLCCTASVGEFAITRIPLTTNQQFNGLVVKNRNQLDPNFLFHYASTLKDELLGLSGKTTIDFIPISRLRDVAVPVPPLAEQQRIVGLLDEAFEGLATAKANAEKNLQNARALFESHLQSVFTQRGPGWVEKSVGELVADGVLVKPFDGNHGEIHPKKSDYTESGVPFIMARDLQDGLVDTEHCIFISRKLADSLRVGFAKDGDVLISHKGTIGRSAIVSTEDNYIMLTPQVTGYRVKDSIKFFNRFIRYYFMSPGFQREMIAGAADGSTRAYIGITKQLTLRFRFPPLAEQKRIAAKLDDLDPETQRLARLYERKQAALEALKKSLLHQAFTGQL